MLCLPPPRPVGGDAQARSRQLIGRRFDGEDVFLFVDTALANNLLA